MEPASLVGLVATLTLTAGRLANDIHNLLARYRNIETVLHSFEEECKMLEFAFRRTKGWLESNKDPSDDGLLDMRVCLNFFEGALNSIQAEISSIMQLENSAVPESDPPKKPVKGRFKKVKVLWNEDTLKQNFETVRQKRSALMFYIQAFELTTPKKTRLQIQQVARAASIRSERRRDDRSLATQESTGYEKELRNSHAYVRARDHVLPSPDSVWGITDAREDQTWKKYLSHLSIGNTVLALRGYQPGPQPGPQSGIYSHLNIERADFVKILEKRNGPLWLGEVDGRIGQFPIGCCDNNVALTAPKPSLWTKTPNHFSTRTTFFILLALSTITWLMYSLLWPVSSNLPVPYPLYSNVEDPLLAAAAAGSMEKISEVVKSYTDNPMEGALLAAAACGSFQNVSELLEQGIKPNVRDSKLRTPLHLAAANGNNETIALLLKYKTTWFADDNITPLHLAARYGHTAAVLQITQTSTHDVIRDRATFSQATRKLQDSVGMALGQHLANFLARKTFSARELAVIFGHGGTALAFPDSQADYLQAFSCASMLGDAQLVETLWNHHNQLLWQQKHGSLGKAVRWFPAPPLHLAVMSGDRATVAFLLEQGLDPNDQSSRSISRLMTEAFPAYSSTAHYAAMRGSTELLLKLKQRHADLTALDHQSRTPLSYAVENLNTEAVEFLVKQKYRKNQYLGPGHKWQDKKRKLKGVPDKRIRDALKSLGPNI